MDIIFPFGVQEDFRSDYGSGYPDAMSIGDSMRFAFILFLMTVHEKRNEMTVHENEMKWLCMKMK